MISKRDALKGSQLYVIVDRDFLKDSRLLRVARRALSAGANILQLRDKTSPSSEIIKTAKTLKRIAKKYGVPFIINDRIDVALAIDADGLHIGQGDIDISLAKKLMGKGKMIGVSVKNFNEAVEAERRGADYLGVGPVFKTPIKSSIKPKGLRLLNDVKKLNIPFYAIGGIDCKNIHKLVKKGFKNVAVIRAICRVNDPCIAVKNLKEALV